MPTSKSITSSVSLKMINYFETDAKRINHALKVWSFSKIIGQQQMLSELEMQCLEITAILHDIGIKESEKKYNSCAGNYQEIEGPPVAMELLAEYNLSETILNRIHYIIGHHHTLSKVDDIVFQILIEADALVNIFEDRLSKDTAIHMKEKWFKTATGKQILNRMYL